MRKVSITCYATIGQVGNLDHENVSYGKAGRKRWLGRKPHNRAVSMNPVDHPMGGARARPPVAGTLHAVGRSHQGYKTRNKRTDGCDRAPPEQEVSGKGDRRRWLVR